MENCISLNFEVYAPLAFTACRLGHCEPARVDRSGSNYVVQLIQRTLENDSAGLSDRNSLNFEIQRTKRLGKVFFFLLSIVELYKNFRLQ